jgi:hypothetical protein
LADKYLIHGATYCGDGTSSAEATVAGGVGAWNDIAVFEGSAPAYGALAAGDTVHIRSRAHDGTNIARALTSTSVNLGKSGLTAAGLPVAWVLDGGTIWPGVSGTLTYTSTGAAAINVLGYNRVECDVQDALALVSQYSGAYSTWANFATGSSGKNLLIDCSYTGYTGNGPTPAALVGAVLESPHIMLGSAVTSAAISAQGSSGTSNRVFNPNVEVPLVIANKAMFSTTSAGSTLEVYGGSVSGAGATSGMYVANVAGGSEVSVYGTSVPPTLAPLYPAPSSVGPDQRLSALGLDGGFGAYRIQRWGYADSRQDGNYPTLNSTYPNSSNAPWSWKLYPVNASWYVQMVLPRFIAYASAPAIKTVTLDLLVASTFSGVDKSALWIDVVYTDDATGLQKYQTTRVDAGGALDSSTAAWSATTYGAVSLNKVKLSLTTATSIKQDTMVTVLLRGSCKSVSVGDLIFVDGDPQLT